MAQRKLLTDIFKYIYQTSEVMNSHSRSNFLLDHCDVIVTSSKYHDVNLKQLFESTFKLLLRNRLLNIKHQKFYCKIISIVCASLNDVPNQHRVDFLGIWLHPYPYDHRMTNSFFSQNSSFPNSLEVGTRHLLQPDWEQCLRNHQRQKTQLFVHSNRN